MFRVLDPDELKDENLVGEDTWSQYDGDEIHSDYTSDGQTVTVTDWYELGIGKVDPWRSAGSWGEYYHADMIGSTRFMTDSPASPEEPTPFGQVVYTAFGQRVDGSPRRLGCAGEWGYQGRRASRCWPPPS